MKCFNCGKELADNAKYCSVCGEEQGFSEDLLRHAQAGEEDALSELYRRTYAASYKMAAVLIKDEDAAMDVLQDSYVKAFRNLNQLREPDKFRAWMKRIVHNRAVDYLRKQKPAGVSSVSYDQENTGEIPDDRISSLPEEVMDQKETARLIGVILDGLSQEQRAVIVMFYYEQLSVRDISYTLGINENTVKSRLMLGRKNIEAAVKKLEKQGTKLYGLSPIPFLLFVFRNWDTQAAFAPDGDAFSSILHQTAAGDTLGQAVASAGTDTENAASTGADTGNAASAGAEAGSAVSAGAEAGSAVSAGAEAGSAAAAGTAAASGAAAAGAVGKSIAVKVLIGLLAVGAVGGTSGALYYFNSQPAAERPVSETEEEPEVQPEEEETGFTGELLQNVNYDAKQEPGEVVVEPYVECFPGSDIPKPDLFFDLETQNWRDTWEQTGEAYYEFYFPAQEDGMSGENGNAATGSSSLDAMQCVDQMNTYLTGRGYGRESCYTDENNGGTIYIWYKEQSMVRISVISEDYIDFSALNQIYVPETLGGSWKGEAREDGVNYTMTLHFDDGQVYYMYGVKDSDVALVTDGTYTVEEDKIRMTFEEEIVSGEALNWDCVYRFKAVNGTLEMEYLSGDSINSFQEEGDIFTYDRAQSSEVWLGEETEFSSEESAEESAEPSGLSEEEQRYICEQLGVPESADVELQLGEEYYWEGAGVTLLPVFVYENGVCVASADVNKDTKEAMTSIMGYQN